MKKQSEMKQLSRSKFLLSLGSFSLLPLLSPAKTVEQFDETEELYDVLLKPDGTTVKVKKKVLNKSETIKSNLNNAVFLKWLKK